MRNLLRIQQTIRQFKAKKRSAVCERRPAEELALNLIMLRGYTE